MCWYTVAVVVTRYYCSFPAMDDSYGFVEAETREVMRTQRIKILAEHLRAQLPKYHECARCSAPSSSTASSSFTSSCSSSSPNKSKKNDEKVTKKKKEDDREKLPVMSPPALTTVLRETRLRELGCSRTCRPHNVIPALLQTPSRRFICERGVEMGGRFTIAGDFVATQSGIYDVVKERSMTFEEETDPDDLNSRVLDIICLHESSNATRCMESPNMIIVLTNKGHVRFYDASKTFMPMIHTIILPLHRFKFKRLEWNKKYTEFVVSGHEQGQHIDDIPDERFVRGRRPPLDRSMGLVCIEILPEIRVRCFVELSHEFFGHINAVCIRDDSMVCMGPKRTAIYDFRELYSKYCTSIPNPSDYGDPSNRRIVTSNMDITEKPEPNASFSGNLHSVDVGGTPMHVLLQSEKSKEKLRLTRADGVQPVSIDGFKLLAPQEGVELGLQISGTTLFHPDNSGRLLRFEGVNLSCYMLESTPMSSSSLVPSPLSPRKRRKGGGEDEMPWPPSTISHEWKTRIVPPVPPEQWAAYRERVQPRSQRRAMNESAAESDVIVRIDNAAIVRQIRLLNNNILAILLLYDADLQIGQDNQERSEWLPIILMLDSRCGRPLSAAPVNSIIDIDDRNCLEDAFSLNLDQLVTLGDSYNYIGDRRLVTVSRLVDEDQMEWHNEVGHHVPTSTSSSIPKPVNRRSRRLKRRAERAAGGNEMDEEEEVNVIV